MINPNNRQVLANALERVLSPVTKTLFGRFSSYLLSVVAINQAQASEQFLASIKLASNKAICLKTKKINKSNMYF